MDYNKEYIERYPLIHANDSLFKVQDIYEALQILGKVDAIADVGCGAGDVTVMAKVLLGASAVCGYDVSDRVINFAQRRHLNSGVLWKKLDVLNESPGQSVDLALCLDVLEHIHEASLFLLRVSSWARYVLIRIPLERCWVNEAVKNLCIFDAYVDSYIRYGHVHHFSVRTFMDFMGGLPFDCLHFSLHPLRQRTRLMYELLRLISVPLGSVSRFTQVRLLGGFLVYLGRVRE